MKILIAGATGVIGRKMLPFLLKEGREAFAMSRDNKNDNLAYWLQDMPKIIKYG